MEKNTLRNILVATGDYTNESDLDAMFGTISRRSALINCVKDTLKGAKLGGVQVLITKYNGQLCIKLTDWGTNARKERLDSIMSNNFCESLTLVKETKSTEVYAM